MDSIGQRGSKCRNPDFLGFSLNNNWVLTSGFSLNMLLFTDFLGFIKDFLGFSLNKTGAGFGKQ